MTPLQQQKPRAASSAQMIPGFTLMTSCRFEMRTVEEAEILSRFAAEMFPDYARVQPGLYEILLNAVEHGCLGIGGMKSTLTGNGTWEAEVRRRQSLSENRKKTVEVVVARKPQGVFAVINDPGPGFDWKSWIMIDPARADERSGRGIARARGLSFDEISYNAAGNQAVVFCKNGPGMTW